MPEKPGAEVHFFVDALGEGEFFAQLEGGQKAQGDSAIGRRDDVVEVGDFAADLLHEKFDDLVHDDGLLDQPDLLEIPLRVLARGQLEMALQERVRILEQFQDLVVLVEHEGNSL